MAENLLESQLQKKSPKEVGEQYFNDLLSWSFFQQSSNKEGKCFIMHDLLNDLAKQVCEDICIRLGVDEPKGIPKTIRHLSFSFSATHGQYFEGFESSIDTQKLHTFIQTDWTNWTRNFYFGFSWYCKMSIDDLFSKFKFMRVLSLSYCSNLREVPETVGNLKHLRSLDLSHTDIEKLPDSISLLYKLQILKLNNCEKLQEFPSYLDQLKSLCCLEFINTGVKNVPEHLGKLKNLQLLMNSFCVNRSKEFGIKQLRELNLHGSLTMDELENIENPSDALEVDLKNKPHLVDIELRWNSIDCSSADSTKVEDVIENLRPSEHLKNLSIQNYVGKQFPNWLLENSIPNLVSLVLRNCVSCKHFPPLESFPDAGLPSNLEEMRLSNCFRLVGLLKGALGDRSSLERLEISNIDAECFPDEGSLPLSITSVSISDSPNLKQLDYKGLHELSSLNSLTLVNCPNLQCLPEEGLPKSIAFLHISGSPLAEQLCEEEGEDRKKIAYIEYVNSL